MFPVNAAIPANTTVPMHLTSCETAMPYRNIAEREFCYTSKYCYANVPDQWWDKCSYGNMAESEVLGVWVATLLRKKVTSILRVISSGSTCSWNCQDFYFIVPDIWLVLPTPRKKENRHCSGITFVRTNWRANPILVCDVICWCHLYDCEMWCSQKLHILRDS